MFLFLLLAWTGVLPGQELLRDTWNPRSHPVPQFDLAAVPGLDVGGLSSGDLADGSVYMLNVFASWCEPCHWEHSRLMEIARSHSKLTVSGVNQRDDPAKVKAWLTETGNPFELVGADVDGAVSRQLGTAGLPETLLVRDGVIRFHWVGPLTPGALQSLDGVLEELLIDANAPN